MALLIKVSVKSGNINFTVKNLSLTLTLATCNKGVI